MSKLVDFDDLFPGRFLKAGQLHGKKQTITIADVDMEDLPGPKGDVRKGIIKIKGTSTEWVLNRTNAECLRAMFGRSPKTDWVGKRVTIHGEMVTDPDDRSKKVLAIRVYGSPDIERDMTFRLKLPNKSPQPYTLRATGANAPPKTEPEPPEAA
jgi:hypothetical protein